MNSYEFEVICKNALIDILEDLYCEDYDISELQLVWFSKALQNWKCIIIDLGKNNRLYECTFNGNKQELYVDIYDKQHNIVVTEFKKEVKKED